MLVEMLKAVEAMLDKPNKSKIACAKIILQKIILEIEKKPIYIPYTEYGNRKIEEARLAQEGLSAEAIAAQDELTS